MQAYVSGQLSTNSFKTVGHRAKPRVYLDSPDSCGCFNGIKYYRTRVRAGAHARICKLLAEKQPKLTCLRALRARMRTRGHLEGPKTFLG